MKNTKTKEFFKKGTGSLIYGVVFVFLGLTLVSAVLHQFSLYYSSIVAQTRADIICDAVAVSVADSLDITDNEKEAQKIANTLANANNKVLPDNIKITYKTTLDNNDRTVSTVVDLKGKSFAFNNVNTNISLKKSAKVSVIDYTEIFSASGIYPDNPEIECTPLIHYSGKLSKSLYKHIIKQFDVNFKRYNLGGKYNPSVVYLHDIAQAMGVSVPIKITLPAILPIFNDIEFVIDNYYNTFKMMNLTNDYEFNNPNTKIALYKNANGVQTFKAFTNKTIEFCNSKANDGVLTAIVFEDGNIFVVNPVDDEIKDKLALSSATEKCYNKLYGKNTLNNMAKNSSFIIVVIKAKET